MERVPIKRILCPIDFSEYSVSAYKYAFSLAQCYGAKLFVQHVVEIWKHPCASFAATADDYNQFLQTLSIVAKRRLHSFVQSHSSGYVPEYLIQEGSAAESILSFADKESINLIVIGAHGIRGADRFVLGSVTEKVLRKSHCPVLAVHETPSSPIQAITTAERGIDLKEILFCTDFSGPSNSAIEYALSIAEEYKANLTLVHVLDGTSLSRDRETTDKAHRLLKELIPQSLTEDCRIETTVRIGSAYKEICRLALEKKADLTIMAVHGRNSLERAVFGSTTYRVVQLGTCPVLAVHS